MSNINLGRNKERPREIIFRCTNPKCGWTTGIKIEKLQGKQTTEIEILCKRCDNTSARIVGSY